MNILVTGGAGYIGSVVVEGSVAAGHRTIVFDNLVKGHREVIHESATFVEGDLADRDAIVKALRSFEIDAVIHMAAYSLVGESVTQPSKYYRNNVLNGIQLLDAMVESGVKKLVFSSTAAVYGEPANQPIEESDPTNPTNPYGETKLAFEHALKWYEEAYDLRFASLRYFNAAGATELCGEMHDPETHLIPIVLQAAGGAREAVDIFGDDYPTPDGTCVRDYIHVRDLASAHLMALRDLDNSSDVYNLGCGGDGYSVREVITAAEQITGKKINTRIAARREGDPAVLIASSKKISEKLGWKPERQDLGLIIKSAWDWYSGRDGKKESGQTVR
jgi:UDP-glucose 4-epimerase